MPEPRSFGQQLREYRHQRQLTQAALAEEVGCAVESIRKMEANRQRPSRSLAARLATILHLSSEQTQLFCAQARLVGTAEAKQTPSGLPLTASKLINRQSEVATLHQYLNAEHIRMITLTGPGGVGKTRLALQIAQQSSKYFPDGVYFVDLAQATSVAELGLALSQALNLPSSKYSWQRQIQLHFQHARILLILDNLEQLLSATAVLRWLLDHTTGLKLLLTSRALLHCAGEYALPLAPLRLPTSSATLSELKTNPAVQLFVQRAQTLNPQFSLTSANAEAIKHICWQVDGLPLALELAAARTRLLTPEALLAYLQPPLALLTTNDPTAPARHQSMHNAINWSYQQISPQQQQLLRQLAIFQAGCTLDAIQAIVPNSQQLDLLDQLAGLIDHSLLAMQAEPEQPQRFRMLSLIQEFAAQELSDHGELSTLAQRHLKYYVMYYESLSEQVLEQRHALLAERENMRAAINWAIRTQNWLAASSCIVPLAEFWYRYGTSEELQSWLDWLSTQPLTPSMHARCSEMQGYIAAFLQSQYRAGQAWYQQALAQRQALQQPAAIAENLAKLGEITMEQGHYTQALEHYRSACSLYEQLGDQEAVFAMHDCQAMVLVRQSQFSLAQQLLQQSLAYWQQQQILPSLAFSLNYLGVIALYQSNFAKAQTAHEQALAIWRSLDDQRGIASALNALTPVLVQQGQTSAALAAIKASLQIRWSLHDYDGLAWNLERFGELLSMQGQAELAIQCWSKAQQLRTELALPLFEAEQQRLQPTIAHCQQQLSSAQWQQIWFDSQNLGLASVVETLLAQA
ncbi:ATP-binding protein [Herpetosiphon giganteus]|uniref:ATP-binding protein n=1 Tax=Herpetosiphon giganteus TaxID=2029754 RepID=UPI00195F11DC|nr:tetratricopeptide repeat protein [Herpetosiphon giganteus]MBM7844814.1 putative ATPase/DNA-binding XRE family transcriptional regulator [Herpetosiphon giganteus]